MFRRIANIFVLGSVLWSYAPSVEAGCGCEKPPPAPAQVRPHATYAGSDVTLFDPSVQPGAAYTVVFTSGTTGESATVATTAISRRDLADGVTKPQLVVALPELPLGPTSISVATAAGVPVLALDDNTLTVVPEPLALPETLGVTKVPGFQAAVSRDGVVYISLDLSQITLPRVFQAQAQGYPLRFAGEDCVFYNAQGFLMQLLDGSIPGLFSVAAANAALDSDVLQYSRHEFSTYFLQHAERDAHDVATDDPNWHLDSTPHIDHNDLILAIAGTLDDGSAPMPGATPPFTLVLKTYSLFSHGLIADDLVNMTDATVIEGYNQRDTTGGPKGDVLTNGLVKLAIAAMIKGNATAAAFDITDLATVSGEMTIGAEPFEMLPVYEPSTIEHLGSIVLSGRRAALTLTGPATYQVTDLILDDRGTLTIDNTAGPVTLYVTGQVVIKRFSEVISTSADPERFALYVVGPGPVFLDGRGQLYGVVYAPDAQVRIDGNSDLYGAFVAREIAMKGRSFVHYDVTLREGRKALGIPESSGGGGGGKGKK